MPAPGEAEWLESDTDAALEWVEWKATLCPGCGRGRHDTFNPDNEGRYTAEPLRCFACASRDRSARTFADDEHADTSGLYYAITDDEEAETG